MEQILNQPAQEFLDLVNALIVSLDSKGKIVSINKKGAQILGYKKQELIGKNWFDTCLPKEERKKVKEIFNKLIKGESNLLEFVENLVLTKKGKEREISWHNTLIKDSKGKIIGTISSGEDVTEREKMGRELREEKEFSESIFNTAQTIILVLDAHGRIIKFNPVMEKISGYKLEEVKNKNWFDTFLPKEDSVRIKKLFNQAVGNVQTKGNINPIITKNKEKIFIEWYDKTLKDNTGKIIGLVSIGQEVTKRKEAEEKLKESEEKFSAIFENAPDIIFLMNLKGNIINCNKQILKLTGYNPSEIMGKNLKELKIIEEKEKSKIIKELREGKIDSELPEEYKLIKKSGDKMFCEMRTCPVQIKGETLILGIIRDISENKKAQEAIKESEEKYKNLLNNLPQEVFYKDTNLKYLAVNLGFARELKMKPEEIIGKDDYDFFPKELAEKYRKDDRNIIKTKEKEEFDETFSASGKIKYVHTIKIPIFNEEKKVMGIMGIFWDITEMKKAGEEIRESKDMLQKIIDLLPTRIFWKDKELRYLGCNLTFAKDAGKSNPEELIGKDDFQMSWKEQAKAYREDDQKVIETNKEKINYEEPQTTPSGEKIWLLTTKVPLKNDKNKTIGILGAYSDITEIKNASEKRKHSEEKFKRFFDLSVDPIIVLEKNGEIKEFNPKAKEFLGFDENSKGKNFFEIGLFRENEKEKLYENFKKRISGEKILPYTISILGKDKEEHLVEITAAIMQKDGEPQDWVIMHDLTSRKEYEETLKKKTEDAEKFNKLSVGRVLKMIELKKEVNSLLAKAGEPNKYNIQ
jgi:PAS domain S-box-containing protein